jgi:hypothetical protein
MARFCYFPRCCPEHQNAQHSLPVVGEECRPRVKKATVEALTLAARVDRDGLVLGHAERSSKPQTAVEPWYQLWYRPGSRCVIRKITARGRTDFALAIAHRTPALAAPSGSRALSSLKP